MDIRLGERGIALVITLIMLAVITFMAVTFLVLATRERNSTTGATDQKIASMAADSGQNRAMADLMARILLQTNYQNVGLMSPTNFIRLQGYDGSISQNDPTNVNYDYVSAAPYGPLTPTERYQNIANLWLNPRAPVYVVTNPLTGTYDFRYYLDLNRNGRFDRSGTWPVIVTDPATGNPQYLSTNALGQLFEVATNYTGWVLSNSFSGDPEWIGVLERPAELHSSDNRFTSRYTYVIVPSSDTLDLNYIHNRAKRLRIAPTGNTTEGYLRNQGVGSYEINLAGFLADLNTNIWWMNNNVLQYNYSQILTPSTGWAFSNANDLLNYRYTTPQGFSTLAPATVQFSNNAAALAGANIDVYSQGPLMLGTGNNAGPENVGRPWPGSDNTNHFFTIQDVFNPSKAGPTLPGFLQAVGTSNDSYNAYTYYRLLAQLGTDSAAQSNKINVNWKNTDSKGHVVPGMETNLIPWTPIDFFTNAAMAMFNQAQMHDMFGNLITVTNIPIYENTNGYPVVNNVTVSNNINYYTPAVHRILQLAANMYDATTNRNFGGGATNYPTVFRPIFKKTGTTVGYISGYTEVSNYLDAFNTYVTASNYVASAAPSGKNNPFINIYGVPWVIGAKKGFPNFNEMSMNNPLYVQRIIMFTNGPGVTTIGPPWTTNQMYQFAVSNNFGVEAWNSYTNAYGNPLRLVVSNQVSIQVSNEFGYNFVSVQNLPFGNDVTFQNGIAGWSGKGNVSSDPSFQVPLLVSANFTNGIYLTQPPYVVPLAPPVWGVTVVPHFFMSLSFQFQFVLIDKKTLRVIDFVNLVDTEPTIDVDRVLANGANNQRDQTTESDIWETNLLNGVSEGVLNEIDVGEGNPNAFQNWTDLNKVAEEIAFRAHLNGQGVSGAPATNNFQDPYPAQAAVWQLISWQANDPLVHYTARDMTGTNAQSATYNTVALQYSGQQAPQGAHLPNLGKLNVAYQPWGGNPNNNNANDFNYQVKDPGVMQSDSWDFPTNKLPNIGWLGRIHRGTSWQTVYMKSSNLNTNAWLAWCNDNVLVTNGTFVFPDWYRTYPQNDYALFDLFTSSLNENSTRGQLNVNQTNLASWSAVLSGVNVINNDPVNGLVPETISPAGVYDLSNNSPTPVAQIWQGINNTRGNQNVTNGPIFANQAFQHVGDVLATPQLTVASPFINTNGLNPNAKSRNAGGLTDEVVERIPQQIMSLLTLNQNPRFVIYSFGQTLHPANQSLVPGGSFNGLCTNYQVTAETATRTVVRLEGSADPQYTNGVPPHPDPYGRFYPPHLVVEQFNVMPPY